MTTTSSMGGRLLALLLALLIAMPTTVWAQDGAAAAAEYYNQATEAYQQGDYEKAAKLLDLAYGANPAELVYKYNRILALQALGDYERALSELNALYAPMKADSQNRFDDIDEIRSQLEAAIEAKKTNEPDPNPDPDSDPNGTDNTVTGGTTPQSGGSNTGAIVMASGGALLLTTGVLFISAVFLPGNVKECLGINNIDANCDSLAEKRGETTRVARKHAEDVRNAHIATAVSLMAGGAVVGGIGLVLLLTGNKKDGGSEAPMSAGLDSLIVAPYVSHDGGGATLQLRF